MNQFQRVKANTNILKFNVSDNQTELIKFQLMNTGESVKFKIISQKERKYHIEPTTGTILKSHSIEISLDLLIISTDIFTCDDVISVIIFDKESSSLIHTIDLPLRVVIVNNCKVSNIHSIRPPSGLDTDSPKSRLRAKATAPHDDLNTNIVTNDNNVALLSHTTKWILKKIVLVALFCLCVVVIMLPLRGSPINDPHPLDSWVIHLARIWPENLLPNHLIQYLSIMVLGAIGALFLFVY